MGELKHLNPANVKLIELIAGMTAQDRRPEVNFGPPVGRNAPNEEVRATLDEPVQDAAGEARPTWRRGCDYGVETTVAAVNRLLDEIERGAVFTHSESASLEALKARLRLMMADRL